MLTKLRARIRRARRRAWLADPNHWHAFHMGYLEGAKDTRRVFGVTHSDQGVNTRATAAYDRIWEAQ